MANVINSDFKITITRVLQVPKILISRAISLVTSHFSIRRQMLSNGGKSGSLKRTYGNFMKESEVTHNTQGIAFKESVGKVAQLDMARCEAIQHPICVKAAQQITPQKERITKCSL